MFKKIALIKVTLPLVALTYALAGFAQDKIEGVVTSTKLTMCKFEPGGCAGNLTLETKNQGKVNQVVVDVPLGTKIHKGNETVYLPALRGRSVNIALTASKGEKTAQSIEVLAEKP
ncbi:MAG: hypothetical protein NVSMB6_00530 [Burkholderiaceae bacterium]